MAQNEDASIQDRRAEQFDEDENYVNHLLWSSQSPDLNSTMRYFGATIFSTTIIKCGNIFWKLIITPLEFHTLVKSITRISIKKVCTT